MLLRKQRQSCWVIAGVACWADVVIYRAWVKPQVIDRLRVRHCTSKKMPVHCGRSTRKQCKSKTWKTLSVCEYLILPWLFNLEKSMENMSIVFKYEDEKQWGGEGIMFSRSLPDTTGHSWLHLWRGRFGVGPGKNSVCEWGTGLDSVGKVCDPLHWGLWQSGNTVNPQECVGRISPALGRQMCQVTSWEPFQPHPCDFLLVSLWIYHSGKKRADIQNSAFRMESQSDEYIQIHESPGWEDYINWQIP